MDARLIGRGSIVLATVTVHVIAFVTAYAVVPTVELPWFGGPIAVNGVTWYVPFVLATAALLGAKADEGWFGVAATSLASVLLLALGLPLLLFVVRQKPTLVLQMARSPDVHRMLLLTVYGPLVAALAALGFGVPLAYLLSQGFRGQAIVESLVDLPLVVPHTVAGLLILFGFGNRGVFPWVPVLSTFTGMVLALTFLGAPFAVNAAREAFESVDESLVRAARSQGASPFEAFRRVSLPLAGRGVLTGGVLAWARGVSEFGAIAVVAYTVGFSVPLLGEFTAQHAPVFIHNTYTSHGLAESGAVGVILLAMSVGVFLLVRWLAYDDGGSGVI